MAALIVSSKREVIKQVVISFLMVITVGRFLVIETNKAYLAIGIAMFVLALFTAIRNIVYMQWRANRGWTSEVHIPDEYVKD